MTIAPWFARPEFIAPKAIAVIGSGLAGLMNAYQLKRAGFHVEIFEAGQTLPNPQCLNPAMVLRPYASPDHNFFDQYYTPGFAGMREFLQTHVPSALIHTEADLAVVDPHQLSQFLAQDLIIHFNQSRTWAELKSQFDAVIIATGIFGNMGESLPGQVSIAQMAQPGLALHYDGGYCLGDAKGQLIFGASFRHDGSLDEREQDHQQNLANLAKAAPELARAINPTDLQAFVGMRYTTKDHLPIIGGLPIEAQWLTDYDRMRFGDRRPKYPNCPYHPGVYVNLAHGSKGLSSSFMGSKIITALLTGEPLPIGNKLWEALHPARFWLRTLKCAR